MIVLIGTVISHVNHAVPPSYVAICITIANTLFPALAKFLSSLELHTTEDGKQRSLYVKIAIFRWMITVVLFTVITPFVSTVEAGEAGLIKRIYAIFYSEILIANFLRLADLGGNFQRHVVAPRAKTQDAMRLSMRGSVVELAERYTNV